MEYRNFIRMVGVLLLLSVVLTAFHSSRKRIEANIDDAFRQAIEQDYQHRKSYLTRNYSGGFHYKIKDYALAPTTDRKIQNYSFRTRKGITTYTFKDSVEEKVAKQLLNQLLLERIYRLNPDELKVMFQKCLEAKKISAKVGILCLRDSVNYWSAADSIVPKGAYSTPRKTLDLTGTLKIQAWVDYGWGTLFQHLDPVMYVFLLLLIGVLMWIWPSRKRLSGEMIEESNGISQGIVIDLERQELAIDGVPCTIAKLDLQLLYMLYERLGECLTREEIKQKFWPTDDNAGEKIDTHIKTIRKILKDFPRYQVMTVRGKGYYMMIQ